jgi:hypothetical protein
MPKRKPIWPGLIEQPDDDLEGDLYRYFTNIMEMGEAEAHLAAKKWSAHIRRREETDTSPIK